MDGKLNRNTRVQTNLPCLHFSWRKYNWWRGHGLIFFATTSIKEGPLPFAFFRVIRRGEFGTSFYIGEGVRSQGADGRVLATPHRNHVGSLPSVIEKRIQNQLLTTSSIKCRCRWSAAVSSCPLILIHCNIWFKWFATPGWHESRRTLFTCFQG